MLTLLIGNPHRPPSSLGACSFCYCGHCTALGMSDTLQIVSCTLMCHFMDQWMWLETMLVRVAKL